MKRQDISKEKREIIAQFTHNFVRSHAGNLNQLLNSEANISPGEPKTHVHAPDERALDSLMFTLIEKIKNSRS